MVSVKSLNLDRFKKNIKSLKKSLDNSRLGQLVAQHKVIASTAIVLLVGVIALGTVVAMSGNSAPTPVVEGATTTKSNPNSTVTKNKDGSTTVTTKSPGGAIVISGNKVKSPAGSGTIVTTAPVKTVVTPSNPPAAVKPTIVGVVGPNLISNASAESATSGAPTGWTRDGWGWGDPTLATSTGTYVYADGGHSGSHSLLVTSTAAPAGTGDIKWGFPAVSVTPNTSYQFTDYYKSDVATEVDAMFTVNGVATFLNLGSIAPASNWTAFTTQFTAPIGATNLVVYHILSSVGSLNTDDYSLGTYTPAALNRGIVTINFDDGWLSQYTNGLPLMQQYGLKGTYFIITDSSITNPDPEYMNATQIKTLAADGMEIGNHTETHPDLTTETAAQVQTEMGGAEAALQSAIGVTATDFAYPFGAFNASTIAIGNQYFTTQRSVSAGLNTLDNMNFTALKAEEVDATTSVAQVQAWVQQAIAEKAWLILLYHEIDTVAPAGSGDDAYITTPTNLSAELSYIKSTGVSVQTTAQATNEIKPQL